jgi:hypothetical protein
MYTATEDVLDATWPGLRSLPSLDFNGRISEVFTELKVYSSSGQEAQGIKPKGNTVPENIERR